MARGGGGGEKWADLKVFGEQSHCFCYWKEGMQQGLGVAKRAGGQKGLHGKRQQSPEDV